MASPLLIMGVSLPAGYGPLYGLWASLPVGLRVTGLSLRGLLASLFAGYRPLFSRVAGLSLCGLWASLPCGLWAFFLRVTGVSTGYGRLYGLRASLRVMGLSTGYGRLYGLWASLPCGLWASLSTGYWPLSLRVMGISPLRVMGVLLAGCGRLYGLLASLRVAGLALSTDYSCGSASTATLTRASTGGWRRSLHSLRICQHRNPGAIPGASTGHGPLFLSQRITGFSTDYGLLNGLRASQRITGFSTDYGLLNGLRASQRITGFSTRYGRLCGRRASLRATSFYTRGWHRSLLVTVADLPVPQRSIRSTGISYSLRGMGFSCLLLRLLLCTSYPLPTPLTTA
jgi:hypothetical protein